MGNAFEQRYFATADGAPIGYQVAGREDAPRVLLCNGLGGNYQAYQPLVDALGDRYRFAAWDYRGLFTSAPAREPSMAAAYSSPVAAARSSSFSMLAMAWSRSTTSKPFSRKYERTVFSATLDFISTSPEGVVSGIRIMMRGLSMSL